jgi:hypothetical protein
MSLLPSVVFAEWIYQRTYVEEVSCLVGMMGCMLLLGATLAVGWSFLSRLYVRYFGVQAQGRVIYVDESWDEWNEAPEYRPTVVYTDTEGIRHKATGAYSQATRFQRDMMIPIRYLPEEPETIHHTFEGLFLRGTFTCILGAVTLLSFVYFLGKWPAVISWFN